MAPGGLPFPASQYFPQQPTLVRGAGPSFCAYQARVPGRGDFAPFGRVSGSIRPCTQLPRPRGSSYSWSPGVGVGLSRPSQHPWQDTGWPEVCLNSGMQSPRQSVPFPRAGKDAKGPSSVPGLSLKLGGPGPPPSLHPRLGEPPKCYPLLSFSFPLGPVSLFCFSRSRSHHVPW